MDDKGVISSLAADVSNAYLLESNLDAILALVRQRRIPTLLSLHHQTNTSAGGEMVVFDQKT